MVAGNVIVDGVAASVYTDSLVLGLGLDAVKAERVKGAASAKWRLAWRVAPALLQARDS